MADWTTAPLNRADLLEEEAAEASSRWRIEVVGGPDQGKSAAIEGPITLGTDPASGFPLTDSTVSWHHGELFPGPDGLRVKDAASTNGTFLSGIQVSEFVARPGTLFSAGRTLLRASAIRAEGATGGSALVSFGKALGTTPAMQQLFALLRRAALSESTLLLLGETGTGKGVLAEAVHHSSPRKDGPFVVFDCSAVAPSLIESELFGHVRGAFTGATEAREGAFARARGGTLFLDEVGELPIELQPKLLRVLDAKSLVRVGGQAPEPTDVRIVAATHQDLLAAIKAGRFRQDLYFRLAVVSLVVPPLRERREDVPLLVRGFLASLGRPDFELSTPLQDRLERHPWPGNVRELRNVVERALVGLGIESAEETLSSVRKPSDGTDLGTLTFKEAKDRLVEEFSQEYFEALFKRCERNVSKMARIAGIARPYAHRIVKKYGLRALEEE
jgi:two-component system, NtrC family, response regulator GlrR